MWRKRTALLSSRPCRGRVLGIAMDAARLRRVVRARGTRRQRPSATSSHRRQMRPIGRDGAGSCPQCTIQGGSPKQRLV
eukprot:5797487-Pleurochrysis_carterae.AAC.1